jgi:hypothetical protein
MQACRCIKKRSRHTCSHPGCAVTTKAQLAGQDMRARQSQAWPQCLTASAAHSNPAASSQRELQRRTWTMPFSGLISSVFLEALHGHRAHASARNMAADTLAWLLSAQMP